MFDVHLTQIVHQLSQIRQRYPLLPTHAATVLELIVKFQQMQREEKRALEEAQAAVTQATRDIQLARLERDIARAERNDLLRDRWGMTAP